MTTKAKPAVDMELARAALHHINNGWIEPSFYHRIGSRGKKVDRAFVGFYTDTSPVRPLTREIAWELEDIMESQWNRKCRTWKRQYVRTSDIIDMLADLITQDGDVWTDFLTDVLNRKGT